MTKKFLFVRFLLVFSSFVVFFSSSFFFFSDAASHTLLRQSILCRWTNPSPSVGSTFSSSTLNGSNPTITAASGYIWNDYGSTVTRYDVAYSGIGLQNFNINDVDTIVMTVLPYYTVQYSLGTNLSSIGNLLISARMNFSDGSSQDADTYQYSMPMTNNNGTSDTWRFTNTSPFAFSWNVSSVSNKIITGFTFFVWVSITSYNIITYVQYCRLQVFNDTQSYYLLNSSAEISDQLGSVQDSLDQSNDKLDDIGGQLGGIQDSVNDTNDKLDDILGAITGDVPEVSSFPDLPSVTMPPGIESSSQSQVSDGQQSFTSLWLDTSAFVGQIGLFLNWLYSGASGQLPWLGAFWTLLLAVSIISMFIVFLQRRPFRSGSSDDDDAFDEYSDSFSGDVIDMETGAFIQDD